MLRLRQICLVASDLEPAVADLEAVFGIATCFHDLGVEKFGLVNALLPVGNNFLEVVAPFRDGTAAQRYIERRKGDGGYIVILQCDDIAERQARCERLGIRIVNHMEYGDYEGLQLHPRDTGGSMLETSWSAGDGAPDGPWHPAGKTWKDAVRTDRVSTMTAAELQSPDPDALAARWGEILAVTPQPITDGVTLLPLENGVLRFVLATDGRGEGLGEVDLHVSDRDAIITAAKTRNCPVEGDMVTVCGTRFRLIS
ncbi:MAG: hypothetical protein GKS00_01160 [Alphaproteobacteria bacterium]|nr:hypothetical protein [Alphaproteobacteria bacterium]